MQMYSFLWGYHRQIIFNQLDIMVSYVDIIGQFHEKSMWYGLISCEVASHPFQAPANYWT